MKKRRGRPRNLKASARAARHAASYELGVSLCQDIFDSIMSNYADHTPSTAADRAAAKEWGQAMTRLEKTLGSRNDVTQAIDQAYGTSLLLVQDQAFMAGLAVGQHLAAMPGARRPFAGFEHWEVRSLRAKSLRALKAGA